MLSVGVGSSQQPMAANVPVDAMHRSLQHLTDLACFEPAEFFPRELPASLVIGPVQEEDV
jgi:hypothetical protein